MKITIAFLLLSSLLALTVYGIPCPPEFCPSVSITDIFIQKEVCVATGWTIRENIPYYYLKELQDSYLEVECRLLATINSYPTDIGNYLDSLSDCDRTFDVVVNEVDSGNFDTIRLLLELGKTVLVLNEGGYPSFTANSLYNRVNLFASTDYVHQYRVDITAGSSSYTKSVYSSKMLGGLANLDDNVVLLPPEYYVKQISDLSDLWSYDKLQSVYAQYEKTTTKTTSEESTEVCSTPFGTYISHEEKTTTETTTIKSAFSEIGYNVNPYSASITAPGFYSVPTFRSGDKNVVITNEYLKYLAQKYPNLKLSLFTRTKRVIFENQRVTKVIVETIFGVETVIYVNDYFIFGGHPLETMQLLFSSGFGETSLLQKYGIEAISSAYKFGTSISVNPVYYGCVIRVARNSLFVDLDLDSNSLGYLIGESTLNPAVALNQYRLLLQSSKSSFINTQVNTYAFTSSSKRRLRYFAKYIFQWSEIVIEQILSELDNFDIIVFGIEVLSSKTTSYVVFEGDSPVPVIKSDMFNSQDDIDAILEAINEIKRLTQTSIFSGLSVQPLPFSFIPDSDIFSSSYIKQAIYDLSAPSLYLSGGLPIGNSIDTSIVDFYCRLHQYPNVLVINNGILPVNINFGSAGLSLVIGNYATSLLVSTYEKKTYELYYSTTSSSYDLSATSLGTGLPASTIVSSASSSSESLEQSSSSSTIIDSGLSPIGGLGPLSPVGGLGPLSPVGGIVASQSSSSSEYENNESSSSYLSTGGLGGIGSGIVASQSSSSSEYENNESSSSYLSTGGLGGLGGIGSGVVASQSSSSSEYENNESSSSYLSTGGLGGIGSGIVASQSSSSSEYENNESSSSYLSTGGLGGLGGIGSGVVASQSSSSDSYQAEESNSEYYSSGGLGGGSVVAKSSSSSVETESESEKSSFASYGNGGFVSASSEKESSSYDAESQSSLLSVC